MSSAICFNLDKSKISLSGNGGENAGNCVSGDIFPLSHAWTELYLVTLIIWDRFILSNWLDWMTS